MLVLFSLLFYEIICEFRRKFVYLQSTKPVTRDRAGRDIDGIQRPTMPFVGQAKGKGVAIYYNKVYGERCKNFGLSEATEYAELIYNLLLK